jgi:hypothetical protein
LIIVDRHSFAGARLKPTNLPTEDVVMDDRNNGKDVRYYCLPPYYGKAGNKAQVKQGGGTRFILFRKDIKWAFPTIGECAGLVRHCKKSGNGVFRLEAQDSLSGYPESANRGYHSIDECIEAWQVLCLLGIHPHAVDPAFATTPSTSMARFVNTSLRKGKTAPMPLNREEHAARFPPLPSPRGGTASDLTEDTVQVLADL